MTQATHTEMTAARKAGYAQGYQGDRNTNPYGLNQEDLFQAYEKAYDRGREDGEDDARDREEYEIRNSRKERDDMGDQELFNRALDLMADCHEFEKARALGQPDPFPTRKFDPRDARVLAAGDLEEIAARLKLPVTGQEMCPTHTRYEDI